MLHLAKLRFPEIESLTRSGRALVMLPVGAVEEHGAHLPLGLDVFAAEAYAGEAALHLEQNGYTVILAPSISYGVARQALAFAGTLSLEPATLRALVIDIGRSLSRHGLRRQVILNAHRDLGHMSALEEAAAALGAEGAAQVINVGFVADPTITNECFGQGTQRLSHSARPDREGHGGERETSVALYRFPDLVDQKIMRGLKANFDYDVDAFRHEKKDYWTLSGGAGYFGSPASASAETGCRLVKIRGRNTAQVILKALGSPRENPKRVNS